MKKLTFHELVWYFFIYSIFGMILENVFCLITQHKIESRMGFIIGPFCPIYGLGAILLIIFLSNFKSKWYRVFFFGIIIGAMYEYVSSFVLQALYSVKFWDYSNWFMNINGRTCLFFAMSWGIISLGLIYLINPYIENIIDNNKSRSLDIIIFVFFTIDCILTYLAINSYVDRAKIAYGYNIKAEANNIVTNEVMKFLFPNMIYEKDVNNKVLIRDIFSNNYLRHYHF